MFRWQYRLPTTGFDRGSTLGTFVVEIIGEDVDDPIAVDAVFVIAGRAMEHRLVRGRLLSVGVDRNHTR